MAVFAMVTTRHSTTYTHYGISSLVAHSGLLPEDAVVLIDNDNSYTGLPEDCRDRVQIAVNARPLSFAANMNQAMSWAGERKTDLVFVNNDIIFSPGWFEPLRGKDPSVMSPLSNAELPAKEGDLDCKYAMSLEDYVGKEHQFRRLIRRHRERHSGYLKAFAFTFFAVKISHEVFSEVGPLDESFGIGGGEDKDYCIRCHRHGFELRYALGSYVLHFHGKSTWRGAESAEQTAARDQVYSKRFKEKWGDALFQLFVLNDLDHLPPDLRAAFDQADFRRVIESLRP